MIEIYLYGKLRRYAADPSPKRDSVIQVAPQPNENVEAVLSRVGIEVDEVYHVFLNGNLLATRNTMAPWLGYRQARASVLNNWNMDHPIQAGDRIGLFAEDMASLVV